MASGVHSIAPKPCPRAFDPGEASVLPRLFSDALAVTRCFACTFSRKGHGGFGRGHGPTASRTYSWIGTTRSLTTPPVSWRNRKQFRQISTLVLRRNAPHRQLLSPTAPLRRCHPRPLPACAMWSAAGCPRFCQSVRPPKFRSLRRPTWRRCAPHWRAQSRRDRHRGGMPAQVAAGRRHGRHHRHRRDARRARRLAGLKDRIAAITARAMNGGLDFKAALRERVAMLRGLPVDALERTWQRVRLTPGARELVATMRAHGAYAALVSGGFTFFTGRVAALCGFDLHRSNVLLDDGTVLTGQVVEPILDRDAKLATLTVLAAERGLELSVTLAVGDGANDLDMLRAAGFGIAFRAKPIVAAAARARVRPCRPARAAVRPRAIGRRRSSAHDMRQASIPGGRLPDGREPRPLRSNPSGTRPARRTHQPSVAARICSALRLPRSGQRLRARARCGLHGEAGRGERIYSPASGPRATTAASRWSSVTRRRNTADLQQRRGALQRDPALHHLSRTKPARLLAMLAAGIVPGRSMPSSQAGTTSRSPRPCCAASSRNCPASRVFLGPANFAPMNAQPYHARFRSPRRLGRQLGLGRCNADHRHAASRQPRVFLLRGLAVRRQRRTGDDQRARRHRRRRGDLALPRAGQTTARWSIAIATSSIRSAASTA